MQEDRKLTDEDNVALCGPFSEGEIWEAIKNCDSTKSPGPDGFNFNFIKSYWETIKEDFLRMIHEFYMHGKLVRGLNQSFVVLIPKKK